MPWVLWAVPPGASHVHTMGVISGDTRSPSGCTGAPLRRGRRGYFSRCIWGHLVSDSKGEITPPAAGSWAAAGLSCKFEVSGIDAKMKANEWKFSFIDSFYVFNRQDFEQFVPTSPHENPFVPSVVGTKFMNEINNLQAFFDLSPLSPQKKNKGARFGVCGWWALGLVYGSPLGGLTAGNSSPDR